MASIISERRRVTQILKVLDFEHVKGKDNGWYSFSADDNYNPVFENPSQQESFNRVSADKNYAGPFQRTEKRIYTENARAVCECGKEIELYNQLMGACECPYCGRWHNLFGQELNPPEMWEDDYDY